MEITFGICTDGSNSNHLSNLIKSIQDLNIPWYEIVVIGGSKDFECYHGKNTRWIPFNEHVRPGHITRKKNLITNTAQFPYICLVHDYFLFDKGWYEGLIQYMMKNIAWNILTNVIKTNEDTRHSDWTVNPNYMERFLVQDQESMREIWKAYPGENAKYVVGLPYDTGQVFNKIQYISGGYLFAENFVLQEYPLNETLCWSQEEDLEWSQIVNQFLPFHFNPYSLVILQKPGKWHVKQIPESVLPKLAKFYGINYGK